MKAYKIFEVIDGESRVFFQDQVFLTVMLICFFAMGQFSFGDPEFE